VVCNSSLIAALLAQVQHCCAYQCCARKLLVAAKNFLKLSTAVSAPTAEVAAQLCVTTKYSICTFHVCLQRLSSDTSPLRHVYYCAHHSAICLWLPALAHATAETTAAMLRAAILVSRLASLVRCHLLLRGLRPLGVLPAVAALAAVVLVTVLGAYSSTCLPFVGLLLLLLLLSVPRCRITCTFCASVRAVRIARHAM
jgi:hypothetical protein